MTADELKGFFNDKYGIDKKWPHSYEVDHETYANVCQAIFNFKFEEQELWEPTDSEQKSAIEYLPIAVGPSKGIMFHGVELILKIGG